MNLEQLRFIQTLYYVILFSLFITIIVSVFVYVNKPKRNKLNKYTVTYLSALVIALLFGFRGVNIGTDTPNYIYNYEYKFVPMQTFEYNKDILWDFVNYILSRFTEDTIVLFSLVALGYVFLPLIGLKKILNENILYFYLFFIISPNFFLFGANGIRNGLAASLFLFSFRYYKNYKQWIILIISSLIHLSLLIPLSFYFISRYFRNIKLVLFIYLILLIFTMLGLKFINYIPLEFSRLDAFINIDRGAKSQKILNIPINFLTYSIGPIIISSYFILKKKLYDEFFLRISITYILSSCVYIAAFDLDFAVRFAYLSEFLMPLVVVYPFIKFKIIKYREIYLSLFMLFVFLVKSYKIFVL